MRHAFTWYEKDVARKDRFITILALLATCALSLGLYIKSPDTALSLLPVFIFSFGRLVPRIGNNADKFIFFFFFGYCYFVDDVGYNPWGTAVTPFTEDWGLILFKSFGINGFEACIVALAAFLVVTSRPPYRREWRSLGLERLLMIGAAVILPSLLSLAWGLMNGGKIATAFIQIRYFYLMPLIVFIGFVIIRDIWTMEFLLWLLTAMLVFKSVQGVYVYKTNQRAFWDAEYLFDHFYSAYGMLAIGYCTLKILTKPAWHWRALNVVCLMFLVKGQLLNDRRTAYVALIFAGICVFLTLPDSFLKRYGDLIRKGAIASVIFTIIGWPLPVGPGALFRSFGAETHTSGPSYRDLEDANLLRELTAFPVTGMGWGNAFEEVYPLPSVAKAYPRYRIIPHNTFLSTWCYGGPWTMAGLTVMFSFMIATAGRMIREERMKGLHLIGVLCMIYFIQYFCFVFGDLGLQVNRNMLLGGVLMGGCYRLVANRLREIREAELKAGQTKVLPTEPVVEGNASC